MTTLSTPLPEIARLLGQESATLLMERPWWEQETALRAVRVLLATLEFYGVVLDPVQREERTDSIVRRTLSAYEL